MEDDRLTISSNEGRKFYVATRDILSAPVDAIVNPANSYLAHGGGLAAEIERAAGSAFTQECDDYIHNHGSIPTTKAAATGAGFLPYKNVIHAVGPKMGSGDEAAQIAKTVVNALQVAERLSIKSIAFPAISSGIYQVPLETCFSGFLKAVPWYWQKCPNSCIEEIWLCLLKKDFDLFIQFYENHKN